MADGRLTGFGPVSNSQATLLILGSMPGARSLADAEYYAHPQNSFWRLMGEILGFEITLPYSKRLRALTGAGIALWDVVHSCQREGSLDSSILPGSIQTNDFGSFFQSHPNIRRVACNGAVAYRLFCRHVLRDVSLPECEILRLPSTSPAFTLSYAAKLAAWKTVVTKHDSPLNLPERPIRRRCR